MRIDILTHSDSEKKTDSETDIAELPVPLEIVDFVGIGNYILLMNGPFAIGYYDSKRDEFVLQTPENIVRVDFTR